MCHLDQNIIQFSPNISTPRFVWFFSFIRQRNFCDQFKDKRVQKVITNVSAAPGNRTGHLPACKSKAIAMSF